MADVTEYPVALGWNQMETTETVTVRAESYREALIAARTGWGKAWSSVVVEDPTTGTKTEVAHHRSDDPALTPEQWVAAKLAPPIEVAIINLPNFSAGFGHAVAQRQDIPPEARAVWIHLDGMLYRPAHIACDSSGAIVISPAPEPAGLNPTLPAPPTLIN